MHVYHIEHVLSIVHEREFILQIFLCRSIFFSVILCCDYIVRDE